MTLTPAWGEHHPEELPPLAVNPDNAHPLTFKVEKIGFIDDEFIAQVGDLLQKIPPHLSSEVIQAGITIFVAQDGTQVDSLGEHAAVYESSPARKRIVINHAKFETTDGSYYQISKDGEPTEQDLGSVVAHEFGHAYDWAPAYDHGKYFPDRIRSSAAPFVTAYSSDWNRIVVSQPNVEKQASAYASYLDHFRGLADASGGVPPDPQREAYAEAIAIHLALYLDYNPQRGQRFFLHSFPEVIEQVRCEVFPPQGRASEDISPGMQPTIQPQTTAQPTVSQAAEFAEVSSFGTPVPTIGSVHEFDHPPLAQISGETIRIRGTRFEIDVFGLNPATEYRLLACFDGETIGETNWVAGRDAYSIPTQVGFPPGRYRLTVQATERSVSARTIQTPPVLVDYQPTYLRQMRRDERPDVTSVALRQIDDGSPSREVQVMFSGLDRAEVYRYNAGLNAFESNRFVVPVSMSFAQGQSYRLKLVIPHKGIELFATLELPRTPARAAVFLTHGSLRLELSDSDAECDADGGMLTKVLYLPHGYEESSGAKCAKTLDRRCLAGSKDALAEATRYGTILAVLRIGDRDFVRRPGQAAKQKTQAGISPSSPVER